MSKGRLLSTKNRISSVNNILGLSKSLEIVSSSKFRDCKKKLTNLKKMKDAAIEYIESVPFISKGESITIAVASNRSLCGGYNNNIFRALNKGDNLLVKGKKLAKYLKNNNITFSTYEKVEDLSEGIIAGRVSEVNILFTDYNGLKVKREKIFPWTFKDSGVILDSRGKDMFKNSLDIYLNSLINHNLISAEVSEHFSRMNAMRNAYNNSKDLIATLERDYNKERQSLLTKDILEIIGGVVDE